MSDVRRLVAEGYDEIAETYQKRLGESSVRDQWLGRLLPHLPDDGGEVLDLGCGSGVPVARDLTAAGHRVTGVDGSKKQVVRARRNVPGATFVHADMCEFDRPPASFDAIAAFYVFNHLPPADQQRMIARVAGWLKLGGSFLANVPIGPAGEWTGAWLGTTMYFGHAGDDAIPQWLDAAGLRIADSAIEQQDNEDASFLWVRAVKSDEGQASRG